MNWNQIQNEYRVWAERNFGIETVSDKLLGITEEIGELSRAVLKGKQKIRTNMDYRERRRDAIADISIFLIGLSNLANIDLNEVLETERKSNAYSWQWKDEEDIDFTDCVFRLNFYTSDLSHLLVLQRNSLMGKSGLATEEQFMEEITQNIAHIIYYLRFFAFLDSFDYEEIVTSTWYNEVQPRDWVKYPETGKPSTSKASDNPPEGQEYEYSFETKKFLVKSVRKTIKK